MKHFEITYHLRPDADDVVIVVLAKTHEDACAFAKDYRTESFSCEEQGHKTSSCLHKNGEI